MAESGFFRIGFRGFKKQDVLKYIDEMQAASGERLAQAEELRRKAEEDAKVSIEAANEAAVRVAQIEVELQTLREQNEKLTALAQVYKRDLLEYREKLAAQQEAKTEEADKQAAARIAELEERCALLEKQNARYAAIVGKVGSIVTEARVVSSSYFDAAKQKSTRCIKQLVAFLSDLKSQSEEALIGTDDQRRDGEEYIETLLSDLQGLGASLTASTDTSDT